MSIRGLLILLLVSSAFGAILLQFKDTSTVPAQVPASTIPMPVTDNCVVILTLRTDDTVGVEWC